VIFIVDASVAVRWFIEEELHPNANTILEKLIDEPSKFAVPELFAFEVYSVLHRIHPDALSAFCNGVIPILQSGILRQPMTDSLAKGALRFIKLGLTGYDACYAALADEVGGLWLTFDKKAHEKIAHEQVSCCIEKGLPPFEQPY